DTCVFKELLMMVEHAVAAPSDSSREKYPVPPGAIGTIKLTVPVVRSELILVKYAFGPPYPVLSIALPGIPNVSIPSPSKPKASVPDLSRRALIGNLLLLTTPMSVSSMSSYGGWPVTETVAPVSVTVITRPQPVSTPTGGHCALAKGVHRARPATN